MGLFSNSVAAHPYQNQTWVPPRDLDMEIDEEVVTRYFHKKYYLSQICTVHPTGIVWKLETYVKIVISHFSKPKPGKSLIFVFFFFFWQKNSILTYIFHSRAYI